MLTTPKTERMGSADLIRGIAVTLVVICHCFEILYPGFGEGMQLTKVVSTSIYGLSRLGVPLFLMLTGFFLLAKDYPTSETIIHFWKKQLIPLLLLWEIWTVIYWVLYSVLYQVPFSPYALLKQLLFIDNTYFVHGWYIPMILGIYALLPFVSRAINGIEARILLLLIVVTFCIRFLHPTLHIIGITNTSVLQIASPFDGGTYGMYVILGYFVRKHLQEIRFKLTVWFLCIVAIIITCFTVYMIPTIGFWYHFASLPVASFCMFILLKNCHIRSHTVEMLSKYSFGIFLLHYPIELAIKHYWLVNASFVNAMICFVITMLTSCSILWVCSKWSITRMLFRIKV